LIKGKVIKSTGSWYLVQKEDLEVIACRIIGKFRIGGIKLTNPVAVGDNVSFEMEGNKEENKGIIKNILPRENYVVRQSPRKKHALHLLASNIDQAMVIVTVIQPMLKPGFIDRFLLMTEPHNIPTHIVFNKADLYDEEEFAMYAAMEEIYTSIGYQVHLISAEKGIGMEELHPVIKDKITLISGQSGVGKSTFINRIITSTVIKTQDISEYSGKGQHTTTFAEMFGLEIGGFVIDTPGIKTLSFNNLEPEDVAHNFREFFEKSHACKFGNCSHRNEPKCAVKEAIKAGELSELRYFNYIQILEDIENQNYWERHTDF